MASTRIPTQLNFITGNKNKLAEVQAILSGVIELRNQNVDLVEIQGTVEEVTKDKARRAAEAVSRNFTRVNYLYTLLIRQMIDTRPRSSRRHMSVLQSHERPPRTLHVCSYCTHDILLTHLTLHPQQMVHAFPRRAQPAQNALRLRRQIRPSRLHIRLLRRTRPRSNPIPRTYGWKTSREPGLYCIR
jgi:hypothetical protein